MSPAPRAAIGSKDSILVRRSIVFAVRRGILRFVPEIIKTYPPRGPLQQVRLASVEPLPCFRCRVEKKSKLHAVYDGDWDRRLCNGCYGELLSIYEVKAGTAPDDERAEALAQLLLRLVSAADAASALREAAGVDVLGEEARRLLGTAEYIARQLAGQRGLEWSPAVIGLCKAVELEVTRLVLEPWRRACAGRSLDADIADEHIGRMAKWCTGESVEPPALGAVAYTLRTLAVSERHQMSETAAALRSAAEGWRGSDWLLGRAGLAAELDTLSREHRNRAAHLDLLGPDDYAACRRTVLGSEGLLLRLQRATA